MFYAGMNCDLEIDFCLIEKVECQNQGICGLTFEGKGWTCQCPEGFMGEYCESETNECDPSPCQNGAECVDLHLDFQCLCPIGKQKSWKNLNSFLNPFNSTGWEGMQCEIDVDECKGIRNLCHHGTCINKPGSYDCDCKEGYCGQHCYLKNPCFEV